MMVKAVHRQTQGLPGNARSDLGWGDCRRAGVSMSGAYQECGGFAMTPGFNRHGERDGD